MVTNFAIQVPVAGHVYCKICNHTREWLHKIIIFCSFCGFVHSVSIYRTMQRLHLVFSDFVNNTISNVESFDSNKLQMCAMVAGEVSIGLKNFCGMLLHFIAEEYFVDDIYSLEKMILKSGVSKQFIKTHFLILTTFQRGELLVG